MRHRIRMGIAVVGVVASRAPAGMAWAAGPPRLLQVLLPGESVAPGTVNGLSSILSSDASATLPASAPLVVVSAAGITGNPSAQVSGTALTVGVNTAGLQTLTASDPSSSRIPGPTTVPFARPHHARARRGAVVASGGYDMLIEARGTGGTLHVMRRKIAVVR